jgi:hypothetical protein
VHLAERLEIQRRLSGMGRLLLIVALCASTALAQQANGTLRGQVLDEFGGAIIGANVVAVDAKGIEKTVTTNDGGMYVINGLAPGKYTLRVTAPGFAVSETANVDVTPGRSQALNVTLKVTIEQTKVTVSSDIQGLSTEAENNAGAVVLKGADLDALPEDPDDLAAALQALAGPSAGPNGGQIFIDGFTGGRLPPLASIREIRINANPFSAEYDRLGMGRIEILTKPGSDRFRGQASFNFNDAKLNSRNPFAPTRPPHQSRQYGANFGGPITKKKASFFVDFEKRDVDDEAVINAVILDPSFNVTPFSSTVPIPNRRTSFSPRVDYQINPNNTLVARYSFQHNTRVNGVGGFSLASQMFNSTSTENNVQLTETAVINKKIVNETRFQFERQISSQNGNNSIPTINVVDAFTDGGSSIGQSSNTQTQIDLQNNTSFTMGRHSLKIGGRMRHVSIIDNSRQNFGGSWTFTSIDSYRATLLGQAGAGPSQFRLTVGNPQATVSQLDLGVYAQDDWKVRPNLTVNLGLRYENQDNISSNYNFAPRVGFAWAPGKQPSKTVVRGGFGVFYDRIGENLTLTANRLNGVNQKQYIVTNPTFFPNIPSVATLDAFQVPVSKYQLAKDIQAPYTIQSVISLERQLPHNLKLAVSYINARTLHMLRGRPINAPLPGTYNPQVPTSGVRPFGNIGNIFEYESSGRFNQNQFIVNVSSTLSRKASINAFYVFSKSNSDTDGANTYPANPYDLSGEYSRSSQDIRHRFVTTGSFRIPWGVSLNPFVIVTSGRPFNITLGRIDLNGDTLYTERPKFATDLTKSSVIITRWGAFDRDPLAAGQIIPRNFASGPGSITTNLRVSKTIGFGKETASAASRRSGAGAEGAGRGPMGGMSGMVMGGGDRGGGGGRGGGDRGGGGFGGGGDTGRRYNLTFSLNFQNLLNHTNLGPVTGNLSSRLFGLSNSTASGFGGFGGGGGGPLAYNRKIEASIRFSF